MNLFRYAHRPSFRCDLDPENRIVQTTQSNGPNTPLREVIERERARSRGLRWKALKRNSPTFLAWLGCAFAVLGAGAWIAASDLDPGKKYLASIVLSILAGGLGAPFYSGRSSR